MKQPPGIREDLRLPANRDGWVSHYRWSGRLHPRHRHDEFELNLVASGTVVYVLDERRYDMGSGSLCWLFPAQDHQIVEASADCAMWIAVFRPAAAMRWCPDEPALRLPDPPGHHCRTLAADDARDLAHHCRAARSTQQDPATLNLGLAFLLRAAWQMYRRAPELTVTEAVHPAVARAARLLGDDPALGGDELAARVGLSRARLSRLFHRELGETIVARRERLRVEAYLRRREARPGAAMLSDALSSGFGSYAQFHRAFRRVTGVSPRDWSAGRLERHYG